MYIFIKSHIVFLYNNSNGFYSYSILIYWTIPIASAINISNKYKFF